MSERTYRSMPTLGKIRPALTARKDQDTVVIGDQIVRDAKGVCRQIEALVAENERLADENIKLKARVERLMKKLAEPSEGLKETNQREDGNVEHQI